MSSIAWNDNSMTPHSAGGTLPALGRQLGLWLAVVYPFLGPLLVVQVSGDRYGLSEPLFLLSLLVLLVARPVARPQVHHIFMLLFLGAALVSLFQISRPSLLNPSALRWLRLVAISVPLYLGLAIPVSERLIGQAIRAFLWGGFLAIVVGIVIYWLQIPIHDNSQKLWLDDGRVLYRASGLVGDTAAFGHLIATWGAVALSWLAVGESRRLRLPLAAGVLTLVAAATIMSSSRAAVLNIVATCGVLMFLLRATRRQVHNSSIAGMALCSLALSVIIGWTMLNPGALGRNALLKHTVERFFVSGAVNMNQFGSGRLDNWSAYLTQSTDQFLLGSGYKTGEWVLPGRIPDNTLLCIMLEMGLPGLIAMVAFLCSIFLGLYERLRSGNRAAAILIAVWSGQLMHGVTADTYTLWLTMPTLYLLTGLVLQMPSARTQS